MYEYSAEFYENFVAKPKVFVQATQILLLHWHLAEVLMIFTQ